MKKLTFFMLTVSLSLALSQGNAQETPQTKFLGPWSIGWRF